MKEAHLIGNGQSAWFYDQNSTGLKLTCNLPPFPVQGAYATVMVDFKMMRAIQAEEVTVPGPWVLGFRPKMHMEQHPTMHMKYASLIREFYTVLPPYAPNYTDLSCGHMACHYIASKHKPDVIHMYGFDSIFDFDLRSCSDFYMPSSRDAINTLRLTENWRRLWPPMWKEFPSIKFVLHGKHDSLKVGQPDNVSIVKHKK